MVEFTGERVIPGQVEPDLFNEHFARYAFAARLARQKRVLDVACGSGYGAAELAAVARNVTAIDVSPEAIQYAAEHYPQANLDFRVASAHSLPFPDLTFDLVVSFELIEHLENYRELLSEVRRVLAPNGQFIVSTPNRLYYEETRGLAGPNPFHVHEFDFTEFHEALKEFFPHVSFFVQNHSDTILIQPLEPTTGAEVKIEPSAADPETSHFFLAVCALSSQLGSPTYLYLPKAANVLREREKHIALLEQEMATKSAWLAKSLADHEQLVLQHQAQTEQLQQRNQWAQQLNDQLQQSGERVVALQNELTAEQRAAADTVAQYEAKLAELESEVESRTKWAHETEQRLTRELHAKCDELAKCVEVLHAAEALTDERTQWAMSLQTQIDHLQAQLNGVSASRWYRMGRTLGLGPELHKS